MAEHRLIDANALRKYWLENGENEYVYDTNSFLTSLDNAPTIDPETLPVVRQLREELARVKAERDALRMNPPVEIQADAFVLAVELAKVTAERDAAVGALKLTHDCNFCANDCVNPEQNYCALCHAKGCVCRTCRDGSNWAFQIPREEARP